MAHFDQILHIYIFLQSSDDALPSFSLAGRGQLHARILKVLSEGANFDRVVFRGERRSKQMPL